jgi:hypothetical protein
LRTAAGPLTYPVTAAEEVLKRCRKRALERAQAAAALACLRVRLLYAGAWLLVHVSVLDHQGGQLYGAAHATKAPRRRCASGAFAAQGVSEQVDKKLHALLRRQLAIPALGQVRGPKSRTRLLWQLLDAPFKGVQRLCCR